MAAFLLFPLKIVERHTFLSQTKGLFLPWLTVAIYSIRKKSSPILLSERSSDWRCHRSSLDDVMHARAGALPLGYSPLTQSQELLNSKVGELYKFVGDWECCWHKNNTCFSTETIDSAPQERDSLLINMLRGLQTRERIIHACRDSGQGKICCHT